MGVTAKSIAELKVNGTFYSSFRHKSWNDWPFLKMSGLSSYPYLNLRVFLSSYFLLMFFQEKSEAAEGLSLAEHRCETTTEAIKNSATFV